MLQKKTVENDGYEAVQLGFEDVKRSDAATKAEQSVMLRRRTTAAEALRQRNPRHCELTDLATSADEVKVDICSPPAKSVDVIGTSKGQRLQRYDRAATTHTMGPKTHGGSKNIRHIGSLATNGITSRQGRILKGTIMAGQEGGYRYDKPEPDSNQGGC